MHDGVKRKIQSVRLGHVSQRGPLELENMEFFRENVVVSLIFVKNVCMANAADRNSALANTPPRSHLGTYIHIWGVPQRFHVWEDPITFWLLWMITQEREVGIERHKSKPRTPQQNGLVERMNKTLIERVRCMLEGAGLERRFWGEADKLQPRAIKCTFLGYPDGVKGYKLWCLDKGFKKCIVSRDVVFNEKVMTMKPENKDEISTEARQVQVEVRAEVKASDNVEQELVEEIDQTQDSSLDTYQLARDRIKRESRALARFGFVDYTTYALTIVSEIENSEPATYEEAINCKNRDKWMQAIDEEKQSLLKNETWTFLLPEGCKLISCKWIVREKEGCQVMTVVALSSTEAEYMAATEAIKEVVWLKGLAKEMGFKTDNITVFCDNQSALHLMKNPLFHERSKHIDIKMHFIMNVISSKEVQVQKIHTNHNRTDMFTKAVTQVKFKHCLDLLHITGCY
uniref:Retroviral polymerase SH3-like domain-containing protein n=1 Tax=Cannabis sativa TaxID=3483 RepID=A0A803QGP3_CANSA